MSDSMRGVSIPAGGEQATSFYDAVGGEETFRALVHRFYEGVATDDVLRPLYPDADLGAAEERLRMFLGQYWGGPRTYSEQRGHPRLRMRHVSFRIGPRERDAWLAHMHDAIESLDLAAEHRQTLWDYLVMAAQSLVNAPSDPERDPLNPDPPHPDPRTAEPR